VKAVLAGKAPAAARLELQELALARFLEAARVAP
jgi:hypothetical protein